jgi:hypothetical protein
MDHRSCSGALPRMVQPPTTNRLPPACRFVPHFMADVYHVYAHRQAGGPPLPQSPAEIIIFGVRPGPPGT